MENMIQCPQGCPSSVQNMVKCPVITTFSMLVLHIQQVSFLYLLALPLKQSQESTTADGNMDASATYHVQA